MSRNLFRSLTAIAGVGALAAWIAPDAGIRNETVGAPEFKTLGAMTFGPGNVLLIGDSEAGNVLAIEVPDAARGGGAIELAGIDQRIAQVLGTTASEVVINDLAVHPASKNVYLTVNRGRGAGAQSVLLRVTRDANRPIEEVSLTNVRFSVAPIPNAPAANPGARRNPRTVTVTDLAFADGQVWIAGLSNEEFSSAFRRIAYPFNQSMATTTLQIYHVSHGANETNAPVMTFIPQQINGKQYMLAAYTCTPLVAFEVSGLKDRAHVVGRTVAELGAGNQPIDMVAFTKDGKQSILVANSRHPLMRIDATEIANGASLELPSKDLGISRTPLTSPSGVRQLADLDAERVVVIQSGPNGLDLRSIAKSTL